MTSVVVIAFINHITGIQNSQETVDKCGLVCVVEACNHLSVCVILFIFWHWYILLIRFGLVYLWGSNYSNDFQCLASWEIQFLFWWYWLQTCTFRTICYTAVTSKWRLFFLSSYSSCWASKLESQSARRNISNKNNMNDSTPSDNISWWCTSVKLWLIESQANLSSVQNDFQRKLKPMDTWKLGKSL